jgi:N-methylhydantoinase A
MASGLRLGIDMGGTFTDIAILDSGHGTFTVAKVPSVHRDPAAALVSAVRRGLERAGAPAGTVTLLVHGTTLVTNAILEGKLPPAALVTTEGFRDILEIGRHFRPDMYDLFQDKPEPIIPRDRRFGVRERTGADGAVLQPLDPADARRVAEAVRASGAETVAVCFLNSYVNPASERAMQAVLAGVLGDTPVSASVDVCREIREFERMSTVALNAAALPVMARYLGEVTARVAPVIPGAQILLMQSNGGSLTVGAAREMPARLITSGPAGGALAVQQIGKATGRASLLGIDMGGTSTDISLIHRGEVRMTTEGGIGGYPVKLPMIEINTIGAGGGSLAWLDEWGGLHVGPRSAGADPGPVAYGRGGTDPTVTDANLVLGRLHPDRFLGGEMHLDVDAARRAVTERVATRLGLSCERAAAGILRIANANMERALRVSSAERGYDPRELTLVAFGGAGPLHAAELARAVGIPAVLVPETPGVFSALGLVMADIRHDLVRTHLVRTDELPAERLAALLAELDGQGNEALARDGVEPGRRVLQRTADLRYVGQAYEVNVPVPAGPAGPDTPGELARRFHEEHQRLYAHRHPGHPVEIVSLRLTAIGLTAAPPLRPREATRSVPPVRERRPVYFDEEDGWVDCPIYQRADLAPGAELTGPAIVEQMDSTTVIHARQRTVVDGLGNLVISAGG